MQKLLFLCFLMNLPLLGSLCPSADRDLTIEDCPTGLDNVVRATMAKIRAARLLESESGCRPNCYNFLERIAYAESSVRRSNCSDGGIWRVSCAHFRRLPMAVFSSLLEKNHSLAVGLTKPIINIPMWTSVRWNNLSKPLYSAIAAAMLLANGMGFDSARMTTAQGQACTWVNYTTSEGTTEQFMDAVNKTMEGE